ncbi:MAG: large subunit ribosomal protein [Patescibacteria group bacterium]|nr:large subunit ribosomal protein [Patescibacteria group bacterium]
MSKIGNTPIKLNTDTKIDMKKGFVTVTGPKGVLEVPVHDIIEVKPDGEFLKLTLKDTTNPEGKAQWGLARALINNAVVGVNTGFTKELELVGVGYRVEKAGKDLKIQIGYSHPVIVIAPEGITLDVEGNTMIKVSGIDRQSVGQVAANIRAIRKPEPYKGKGIKYKDEIIKRKQGKASKK